jgi:hypothetical protein
LAEETVASKPFGGFGCCVRRYAQQRYFCADDLFGALIRSHRVG